MPGGGRQAESVHVEGREAGDCLQLRGRPLILLLNSPFWVEKGPLMFESNKLPEELRSIMGLV